MHFSWKWDSGSRLDLSAGKPENGGGEAAIRIEYARPADTLGADASGL